jgi:hypothetical protein
LTDWRIFKAEARAPRGGDLKWVTLGGEAVRKEDWRRGRYGSVKPYQPFRLLLVEDSRLNFQTGVEADPNLQVFESLRLNH